MSEKPLPTRNPTRAEEKRLLRFKHRIMEAVRIELERGDVSGPDLLAILAHSTGACIAYQDQQTMTPDQAMDLVLKNIQAGNFEALSEVLKADGTQH